MGRDDPFAQRLRELLAERGWSYGAAGRRAHYVRSYIHMLATGQRRPTLEAARRLDQALDADGELVALAPAEGVHRSTSGHVDGPNAGQTDDMQRRTLLAALAGLGAGQAVADRVGISALLASLAGRQPDTARTVDDWLEAVWEYGYTYQTTPRPELLVDLSADLATVTDLISRTTGTTALAGLHEVAGRLAGLVAMACTDLGYGREARHSWRLARRYSDSSGSIAARMWVRGQEAVIGLYSRRPLPLVLDLADRGLALAGQTRAAGVASLGSARAQVLAQLGRERDALDALHTVERLYGDLPTSIASDEETIYGWPEHRLRHVESYVHATVGRTVDAYRAQDNALALYPATKAIGRGQVQMHRAACLIRDGDLDGGLGHASTTLGALPAYARGNFVLTIADGVLASVPDGERGRPAARDYQDLLGSMRLAAVDA